MLSLLVKTLRAAVSTGATAWMLAILAPGMVRAQDSAGHKISLESDFRFALVGNSDVRERSETGNLSAYNLGTRDVLSMQVHEGFLVRFGLEYQRYHFGVPDSLQLPSKLQGASLVIGTDLQLGDAWIMRLEVQPGFYGGTRMRSGNFNAPIVFGASYFVNSDLQLVAGLSVDVERKYPVLPGIGFRYKCNADWVLDMILPTPRIEYTLNKSVLLYVGGDIENGTYRVDSDFGKTHDVPKLNDAWLEYTQIRVGVGASWKIHPDITLEFEAGIVPVQEFDFHRADVRASATEIPPYGGVVLKAAF